MKSFQVAVAISVTVAGTSILLYYFYKRHVKNRAPLEKQWQYVGTVEEIMMYPIKSCSGIELKEAKCNKYGIEHGMFRNKIFILVDDDNRVGFAGSRPQMWNIKSEIIGNDELQVTAPSMESIRLNITELLKGRREVIRCVENVVVSLIECDAKYGNWFSKYLLGKESGLRLFVCLNPEPKRRLFRKYEDINPFMAICDESVADLNSRLTTKVHHWQFRGNFLISTHKTAFAEDNWKWMRIGNNAVFRYKAPCYRCILPNINPFTCERSPDFEPLRTLKRYRMKPGQIEPEMGIYFDLHTEGVVKLGDPVYVIT